MSELKNIQDLVERFLDGLTTLDEERRIASFIKAHRKDLSFMPEDLQVVAEMFDELQAMGRPQRIKRMTLAWRWAAAAVTAAAVILGVLIHNGLSHRITPFPSEPVLIVKMSRDVEPLAVDTSKALTVEQSAIREVSKTKKATPRKKQPADIQDSPSGPMQADVVMLEDPTRMPMARSVIMPVESGRAEVNELMLECELKILEDKYQAYASERRTIKI